MGQIREKVVRSIPPGTFHYSIHRTYGSQDANDLDLC